MRDALIADLVTRVRHFHTTGSPEPLLSDGGLDAAAELLRLATHEITGREDVDADALHAVAAYQWTRGLVWQSTTATHDRPGEDPEGRAEVEFAGALATYELLFMVDHRRVPRDLWPYLIRETGHDPWQDPLDRAKDLLVDAKEASDPAAVATVIEQLQNLDEPSDAGFRDSLLGDAHLVRFDIVRDSIDLTNAVSAYRAALDRFDAGSASYTHACQGLGAALGRQGQLALHFGEQASVLLTEAVGWLRRAADGDTSVLPYLQRVMALRIEEKVRAGSVPVEEHPLAADGEERRQAVALLQLADHVRTRVLSHQEATRHAADPSFPLSATAIDLAVHTSVANVEVARLAMDAAEHRWGATRDSPWWTAADAYVEAVRHSLLDDPDADRLAAAHAVATRQLTMLVDEPAERAGTLFAAGLLYLTPYLGTMSGLTFDGAHQLWLARHQRRLTAHPEGDPTPLPPPDVAADRAVEYLRQAADLAVGHDRGRILKALVEAYSFRAGMRQESADDEALAGCRTAFDLLDPTRDQLSFLYVLRVLYRFGEIALPPDLNSLLAMPLATVRDRYGIPEASSVFAEALTLAGEAMRPDLEAELLAAADDHLPVLASDAQRRVRWRSEVHLLADGVLPCSPDLRVDADLVDQVRAVAAGPELAATFIHLAAHTAFGATPELIANALDLLSEAHQEAPELWRWHGDAIDYLEAGLTYDLATRSADDGTHPESARRFGAAALRYALCRQHDLALASLDAGRLQMTLCDNDQTSSAAIVLLWAAAGLSGTPGEPVAWALFEFYQRILFHLADRQVDVNAVIMLHQAAKGRWLASALHSPGPFTASPRLLRELREMPVEQSLPDIDLPGGAETVMTLYAGSGEAETETGPDAVARNRQRAADRRISAELSSARSSWQPPPIPLDELQSMLPPETVFVSLMLGEARKPSGDPSGALHAMAVTRDAVEYRTLLIPDAGGSLIRLYRGSHHLALSPFGIRVAQLRNSVTADPLHRAVSRDAQQHLSERPDSYLAGFADRMPQWHAEGRRHLCVWADGPLHYVPFHLLTSGTGPAADDWTVTQIASPEMLREQPPSVRRGFVAFASGSGGTAHGLPVEDALESHAAQVATAMGGEAVLGSTATPERFLSGLTQARYVHVAAHGSHNEWAPWFQCLYLSGGRVFAHDILRTDLRGVELVTLSACESALGRFDLNDNLRGLPAALLSAGATAVIGCLWPVHPTVATEFFHHLYERLAVDPDRRSAFRAAQQRTRDRHPAYRDWGTFTFVGNWRTTIPEEPPND
ncbi:Tetratricopeptide repeat protein 28 [Actinoplanes sp. SE50]|uniref:CHAT domain-containing protein n=1 Tax=unclassified Actinoplanes TaxID=2626549 RepID=UPI00023EBB43|nr:MULTISPECIES: CHAT domain-containing protein [unclassified Actinoplanes]AEV83403.1 Tetratricopeptide repeat protein 28 [Actinoplanes sp. SE50/110]ATO81796.1 Tetratricopeptide repeat protein 28 [Actinoplanes sp. SE50]SLL99204.1 CHAT domain-containing protein [Actinoplanes sp. SE50/110]